MHSNQAQLSELDRQIKRLLNQRIALSAAGGSGAIPEILQEAAEEQDASTRLIFSGLQEIAQCQRMLADSSLEILEQHPIVPLERFPKRERVACQGVPGAYSHAACEQLFEEPDIVFLQQFRDVFEAVSKGEVPFGLVPLENSSAGQVEQVFNLVTQYKLYICKAYNLKVEHCLAVSPGVSPESIQTVYSHPQGLAQCRRYLEKLGVPAESDINTAAAAQRVSLSPHPIACICSKRAAQLYGLDIVAENIQDSEENYTRFITIARKNWILPGADTISITLSFPNKAGALAQLLTRFALCDLDLSRIQSMPLGTRDFSVIFYLDFKGKIGDTKVAALLSDMAGRFDHFQYLGNYSG
ncbi:prephenate dehydratase domain-containing protein [Oscillospiraceae bacterium MB08-C2-2]|nr:prephenate dehydratase domain-containing protein [Oscillospiraceae bacterium MB08-C2-2]